MLNEYKINTCINYKYSMYLYFTMNIVYIIQSSVLAMTL